MSGSAAAAYYDDETNFFVSGSRNEALSLVNQIVCFMKNTRAEEFVNDGVFRATIYADDCVTTSADSSSADSAKPNRAVRRAVTSGGDDGTENSFYSDFEGHKSRLFVPSIVQGLDGFDTKRRHGKRSDG